MTAESWAHGGAFCNNYSYRFDGVQTADPLGWRNLRHSSTLQDRGWKVLRISPSSFSASNA